MARIGMEYVVFALMEEDESGVPSYKDGQYMGPASTFNMTTNNNDIKDFGDDRTVESDTTLNNITLSVEVNELGVELECKLLGHEYNKESKSVVESTEDVAPFMGLGFIGKSRSNNVTIYRSVWLPKVQFAAPSDENATKQESTTFNHSTLEGTAYPLASHAIREKAEFDSLDAAKAWLNDKAGITA